MSMAARCNRRISAQSSTVRFCADGDPRVATRSGLQITQSGAFGWKGERSVNRRPSQRWFEPNTCHHLHNKPLTSVFAVRGLRSYAAVCSARRVGAGGCAKYARKADARASTSSCLVARRDGEEYVKPRSSFAREPIRCLVDGGL
jgi:hypothetical protein